MNRTIVSWTGGRVLMLSASLIVFGSISRAQGTPGRLWEIEPRTVMNALLHEEDTDGDKKITAHDPFLSGTTRGDKTFWFTDRTGVRHEVTGTMRLSFLLEELMLLVDQNMPTGRLRCDHIYEQPADRLSRSIRERFWSGLTRSIDEAGLPRLIKDEKVRPDSGGYPLYVPASDQAALRYYTGVSQRHPDWRLRVLELPSGGNAGTADGMVRDHGLLALALRVGAHGDTAGVPFVVPGGRFNELYGWDSYFIILGLLADNKDALARSMIENQVYEIERYGAILNANRTYYLTRSQPPFLMSSALACYARMPAGAAREAWMRRIIGAAIYEYRNVWMNSDHLLPIGLSRYHDRGHGVPPEVEPGHFAAIFRQEAERIGMDPAELERQYRSGQLRNVSLDAYFRHDRAMRESGHDTSNRLVGRCDDLATVDLNALLYKMEIDIAMAIQTIFHGTLKLPDGRSERSSDWSERARHRQGLVNTYLWDPDRGIYLDYDVRQRSRSAYESATTFWPLWAGLASTAQARSVVAHALPALEQPGGLAASSERSRGEVTPDRPQRQWDYPYGWAPHQMLAWDALRRYGYMTEARRLAYKWLFTIVNNAAQYNGTVPEKFDVVRRTHQVFAEYGIVGTTFDYITREGFGWTNASVQVGLKLLPAHDRAALNGRIPPECLDVLVDH